MRIEKHPVHTPLPGKPFLLLGNTPINTLPCEIRKDRIQETICVLSAATPQIHIDNLNGADTHQFISLQCDQHLSAGTFRLRLQLLRGKERIAQLNSIGDILRVRLLQ